MPSEDKNSEFDHRAVVREICEKCGWRMTSLDDFSELLFEISDGGRKSFLWRSGCYPLNSALAAKLARDKAHTSQILRANSFAMPEGEHFFIVPEYRDLRPGGRELDDAIAYAAKLGYPVFVKPMDGAFGRDAGVVNDVTELAHKLVAIGRSSYAAMVQRVVAGEEHRIFLVDGEVGFSYRKRPAAIVGDGDRTVESLVVELNSRLAAEIGLDHPDVAARLAARGLDGGSVLPDGERLQLAESANPNIGATIDDFRLEVPGRVLDWAQRIARCMELRIAGIDFFAPRSVDDDPDDFIILEVNANPALKTAWAEGQGDRVRQLWETILRKRFGEL